MAVVPGSISITAVKDEGPFLLEWIAWQKMLGFEQVLGMHNDCTDHSPQLLQLLEREGVIVKKSHKAKPDVPPQPQAHQIASRTPWVREAKWAYVSDVDEFLVIHLGDHLLSDLLDRWPAGAEAMVVHWNVFGTEGKVDWEDRLVHQNSTHAAPLRVNQNNQFKALTRDPANWGWLRSHGPTSWLAERQMGQIVFSDGTPYLGYFIDGEPQDGSDNAQITHEAAQVNHYALQCRERFLLKKGRPSAALLQDRYTDAFFKRFDHNAVEDRSAEIYRARFQEAHDAITAIPGVLRLHHLCCADYHVAIDRKLRRDPTANPHAIRHVERADSLPLHPPGGTLA